MSVGAVKVTAQDAKEVLAYYRGEYLEDQTRFCKKLLSAADDASEQQLKILTHAFPSLMEGRRIFIVEPNETRTLRQIAKDEYPWPEEQEEVEILKPVEI